jgi:hypothetical protein
MRTVNILCIDGTTNTRVELFMEQVERFKKPDVDVNILVANKKYFCNLVAFYDLAIFFKDRPCENEDSELLERVRKACEKNKKKLIVVFNGGNHLVYTKMVVDYGRKITQNDAELLVYEDVARYEKTTKIDCYMTSLYENEKYEEQFLVTVFMSMAKAS